MSRWRKKSSNVSKMITYRILLTPLTCSSKWDVCGRNLNEIYWGYWVLKTTIQALWNMFSGTAMPTFNGHLWLPTHLHIAPVQIHTWRTKQPGGLCGSRGLAPEYGTHACCGSPWRTGHAIVTEWLLLLFLLLGNQLQFQMDTWSVKVQVYHVKDVKDASRSRSWQVRYGKVEQGMSSFSGQNFCEVIFFPSFSPTLP